MTLAVLPETESSRELPGHVTKRRSASWRAIEVANIYRFCGQPLRRIRCVLLRISRAQVNTRCLDMMDLSSRKLVPLFVRPSGERYLSYCWMRASPYQSSAAPIVAPVSLNTVRLYSLDDPTHPPWCFFTEAVLDVPGTCCGMADTRLGSIYHFHASMRPTS